jgi:hypothetical protein
MFEMEVTDTIEVGDAVENFASIYFDINPPVITETAFINYAENWLGHSKIEDDSKISIYPNPSNGQFKISGIDVHIDKIEIIDILGRQIDFDYHTDNSSIIIELNDSERGSYLIMIEDASGKIISRRIAVD